MKNKCIYFFLAIFAIILGGCNSTGEGIVPTAIKVQEQSVKVILNTERDLNDIITLDFEPKEATFKEVSWSSLANDVFTLNGSIITANKIGSGKVKATSTANKKLSVEVNVNVVKTQPVYVVKSDAYQVRGLRRYYEVGEQVTFKVDVRNAAKAIKEVTVNEKVLSPDNGSNYSFIMEDNQAIIDIGLQDKKTATELLLSASNIEMDIAQGEVKLFAFVVPIDTTDLPLWEVIEGNEYITIAPNRHEVMIRGLKNGTAKVKVTYNHNVSAECEIKVCNSGVMTIEGVKDIVDLDIDYQLTLNPILSSGEGTFIFSSSDDNIATVDTDGTVKGKTYGKAQITITSVEYTELSKMIDVEVINHGSEDNPILLSEAINLGNKICLSSGNTTSFAVYTLGTATNNASANGEFDIEDENQSIHIESSLVKDGVSDVAQNDDVVIKGHLKNSSSNIIVASIDGIQVEVISNVRGLSLISLSNHDHTLVKINDEEFVEPQSIKNGEVFNFTVIVEEGFIVNSVKENGNILKENNGVYSFVVAGNSSITISASDTAIPDIQSAKYNITYDLGTRKTPKQLESNDQLFDCFTLDGEVGIINSVTEMTYIYGGGNGGRNETAWYTGNMLKMGTTSVNGSFTLNLSMEINYLKITGYVYDNSAKIRVGNSVSSDFEGTTTDNQTTLFTCSEMNEVSKEIVEANQTSTILIQFASTNSIKIATTNKKPLFITAIEFGVM